jgi:NhaP-type Na+/H+ or K+/H+ antiporter
MGLAGFTIAILAGLTADNTTESVLGRALISMLVCNVVGFLLGMIGERAIREAADLQAAISADGPVAEADDLASSPSAGEAPLAA